VDALEPEPDAGGSERVEVRLGVQAR
jgi:hypothetical protein